MQLDIITPNWPAPSWVHAAVTTRQGGVSLGPYASFNLGAHVGDAAAAVAENRARLVTALALPSAPLWLHQIHGCTVAQLSDAQVCCTGDAAIACEHGKVCAVLTADCLPVLLCDRQGGKVAAVHAGWRGLAIGVIESTVDALAVPPEELLAWLGPAIGADAFEVGDEVRSVFVAQDPMTALAFRPSAQGRWMADLYALARLRLENLGVGFIGGGELCTVNDPARFFSYRRDGVTGRMASLIWID